MFTNQFYFLDVISELYNYINPKTGVWSPMISNDVYEIVQKNSEVGCLELACRMSFY